MSWMQGAAAPKKARSTEQPKTDFRPNIDMLVAPVRNYLRALADCGQVPSPSKIEERREWELKTFATKEKLRVDLQMLGLQEAIDLDN